MDQPLAEIVRKEVETYAGSQGRGVNLRLFPIADEQRHIYAVNAVDYPIREETAGVVVLARVIGDVVVIEEDATDRPLWERLLARGITRDHIILAYAGEPVPDTV